MKNSESSLRELTRLELPFYWRRTDKRTGATLGVPDFIVGLAGVTLWIEFKVPGGVLNLEQTQFLTKLGRQHLALHICRSAAEAIKLMRETLSKRSSGHAEPGACELND